MKINTFLNDYNFTNSISMKITKHANKSIQSNNIFNILLCGGTTPIKIYKSLSLLDNNWEKWHIWLTDERMETNKKNELNKDIIYNNLIEKIPIDFKNFHTINVSNNHELNSSKYCKDLKNVNFFDLSLIGIGEDGHVASLFPGMNWGLHKNSPAAFTVFNSPKLPSTRITLSANRINLSRTVLFIAKGCRKYEIMNSINKNSLLPYNSISGIDETSFYYSYEE